MLYNASGALNVTVDDTTGVGAYAADGSLRVTVVDGSAYVGLYAADGSMNVIVAEATDTPIGRYDACGALRGVVYVAQIGFMAPNGAIYMDGLTGGETPPEEIFIMPFGALGITRTYGVVSEGTPASDGDIMISLF